VGKKDKTAGFFMEFKKFAVRGNVIDLAVGVIIGGAFGKITSSLVNDVLMPFIGGIDFSTLSIKLPDFYGKGAENVLNLGLLLGAVIDFLIIAFVVFLMVRAINRLKEKGEEPAAVPPAPPEPSAEEKLLAEIRDLLKEKNI